MFWYFQREEKAFCSSPKISNLEVKVTQVAIMVPFQNFLKSREILGSFLQKNNHQGVKKSPK